MKKLFTTLCLFSLSFLNLKATTYYIDYQTGSNSNNGTSKNTPWKYHPRMWGFSASYTHSVGDRFIFKGGVTWPNDCFTFHLTTDIYSGVYGNEDYYGVDTSWYVGANFTKPKFSGQGMELVRNAANGWNVFWNINDNDNIVIDSICFTDMYWSSVVRNTGSVAYLYMGGGTNITVKNCEFVNWTHAPKRGGWTDYEDQLYCIYTSNQSPYNNGSVITNCLFDGITVANQTEGQSSCAAAVFSFGGKIKNCTIRNSAGGIFTAGAPAGQRAEVSGCVVGPLFTSYDFASHTDGIQDNGGAGVIIHDNYFFDIYPVPIFLGAGWGGGRYDVYNNIFDTRVQKTQQPIVFDAQSGGNSFYIYNNTLIAGPGLNFFRANWRPSGGNQITLADIRNNHLIGEGSLISIDSGVTITSLINQNNLIESYTAANFEGYTKANLYKPTFGTASTVDKGQNLSSYLSGVLLRDYSNNIRPQGSAFDLGANEWTLTSNPGLLSFTASTYNTTSTNGFLVVSVQRTGGSDGSVSCNYATANGTALSGTDYTSTSGSLTFGNGITLPQNITIPIINSGTTGLTPLTFTINLTGSYLTTPSSATVNIALPPPTPTPTGVVQFASSAYSINQAGNILNIPIQRVGGTNTAISATYTTVNGTATAGVDYIATSGTLNWSAGNAAPLTIPITIINSGITSTNNRNFVVNLSTSVPGSITNTTVTILMPSPVIQPPNTPINSSPINGIGNLATYGFNLIFSSYTDPQSLPMQASRWIIKQGSTVIWDYTQTNNLTYVTVPQGKLANGTTYSFTVAVENTANLWSPFSSSTTFSTATLQNPNAPYIISPASGTTNVNLTTTITGSAFSDPQGLSFSQRDWQIISGASPIYGITNTSTSLTTSSNILNYLTLYGVSIRDKNSAGLWSSYGPISIFTTTTNPLVIIPTNTPPSVGSPYNINFNGTVSLKGTFYFSR